MLSQPHANHPVSQKGSKAKVETSRRMLWRQQPHPHDEPRPDLPAAQSMYVDAVVTEALPQPAGFNWAGGLVLECKDVTRLETHKEAFLNSHAHYAFLQKVSCPKNKQGKIKRIVIILVPCWPQVVTPVQTST